MLKFSFRPEEQRIFDEIAKGRALQPSGTPTDATPPTMSGSNGSVVSDLGEPPNSHAVASSTISDSTSVRLAQASDLMELLRFVNLTSHGDEIQLYYLIGVAYDHGARSGRKIFDLLASPPTTIDDGLAIRIRKTVKVTSGRIFKAIPKLEKLVQTPLVIRLGDNLPFAGLTETGKLFWRLVADYLRKYL